MEAGGRTIYRVTYGSHLFGTDTPQSDLDIRSVFVPTARDILLGRVKGSVSLERPKTRGETSGPDDVEEQTYSLQRFLGLAAEGQTIAVDMLFAPPSASLGEPGPEWAEILANRHRLVTRRSKAFIGYCLQQANKYGVKGSRIATARAALDLLEAGLAMQGTKAKLAILHEPIRAFVAERLHAGLIEMKQPSGVRVLHFEVCGRKLPYTVAIGEAAAVMRRLVTDYGRRALQAESQQGVDWKALSHAVRVASQGLELLETGQITLPGPRVERLRGIKFGQVAYGDVSAEIDRLLADIQVAAGTSRLPDEVDRAWIDDFVERVHRAEVCAAPGRR